MKKVHTHYDNLKVSRVAPAEVIRAAYKSLSQKYHPDKNLENPAEAVRIMAAINAAYEVLSDPDARKRHDQWIKQQEAQGGGERPSETYAYKPPPPNSYRSHTGSRNSARQPGGEKPAYKNSRPIALFALFGIAVAVFLILKNSADTHFEQDGIEESSRENKNSAPSANYKDGGALPSANPNNPLVSENRNSGLLEQSETPTLRKEEVPDALKWLAAQKNPPKSVINSSGHYERPATAPNGRPWPANSGYLAGYSVLASDGLSKLTIDNTSNMGEYYLKLVELDSGKFKDVRHVFIRAGSSFTMRHLKAGRYNVKYWELDSGDTTRSQSFELEEMHESDGVKFSNAKITLYKVQNGTFETFPLPREQF